MRKFNATVTVTILDIPASDETEAESFVHKRLQFLDVKGGLSGDDGFISEENVDRIEESYS